MAAAALMLAGCGGGGDGDSRLVAAIGDSITAGNPGYDPHHELRRRLGLGDDPESQWEYWAQREHPDLEFRNCGVYGERTDAGKRPHDDGGCDSQQGQAGARDTQARGRPKQQGDGGKEQYLPMRYLSALSECD